MNRTKRVMIVDDSFFIRTLLKDLLSKDPEIEVIKKVDSGEEAFKLIPLLRPYVIIHDMMRKGISGIKTLKRIMAKYPTSITIFSSLENNTSKRLIESINTGAVTILKKLLKNTSFDLKILILGIISEFKKAVWIKHVTYKEEEVVHE